MQAFPEADSPCHNSLAFSSRATPTANPTDGRELNRTTDVGDGTDRQSDRADERHTRPDRCEARHEQAVVLTPGSEQGPTNNTAASNEVMMEE